MLCDQLYPDHDRRVQRYLTLCIEARASKSKSDDVDRLNTGRGWEACFARVQKARAYLAAEFDHEAQWLHTRPNKTTNKHHHIHNQNHDNHINSHHLYIYIIIVNYIIYNIIIIIYKK